MVGTLTAVCILGMKDFMTGTVELTIGFVGAIRDLWGYQEGFGSDWRS